MAAAKRKKRGPNDPPFLRNRKTGVIFPFNHHLLQRNRNMEPCWEGGKAYPEGADVDEVHVEVNPNRGGRTPRGENGEASTGGGLQIPDGSGGLDDYPKDDGGAGNDAGQAGEEDQGQADDPKPQEVMIGDKPLRAATMNELVDYVDKAFGEKLPTSIRVGDARNRVYAMIQSAEAAE